MNIFFSRLIKLGDRQREFNFRKLPEGTEIRYHVDTTDDRGNRLIFNIFKDASGSWKSTFKTLPIWLQDAEELLGNIIEEESKDTNFKSNY